MYIYSPTCGIYIETNIGFIKCWLDTTESLSIMKSVHPNFTIYYVCSLEIYQMYQSLSDDMQIIGVGGGGRWEITTKTSVEIWLQ